ncbi:2-hydroxyacid dehydrogenase [Catalinimonas sp. 4WD22]|uniref:2-hydroxyacid dehydrogenase n=1 Tax=Catalinimonas locisalis TaxID=3133978 RepID=UPI003100F7B8
MKTCLIIDLMHESILSLLQQIGWQADYRPEIKREEILQVIHQYEGLIVRSKTTIDKEIVDRAEKLQWIGRAGAGLDQLDVNALEARNIKIVNAPEGNRDALGEHAIALLLSLFNKIHMADRQIRKGTWDREGNRGVELMGKTVGIIGYGFMGQAFARRLQGFSVKVLAYDKYKESYGDEYAQEASLNEIFEQADVLSLHVPLTEETYYMIDHQFLQKFRKDIYLLNTARGKNISFKTLVEALENGKLKGAALDVLENEKITQFTTEQQHYFNLLIHHDNVIFTPHVGGWTFESYEKINKTLVEKIKSLN